MKKIFVLLFFSVLCVSVQAQNFWTRVYITSSNDMVDFCQTDNGYMYSIAASVVVVRSTDAGASWSQPTQTGKPSTNANCLAASGNTLFLGNYSWISTMTGKGVFVSTDFGATWTKKTNGMGADTNIVYIRVHRNGNVEAFHQYDDGFGSEAYKSYVSTDGGNSWSFSNSWGNFFYGLRYKFVFTPNGTYMGRFKTTNNGISWTNSGSSNISPVAYSAESDSLFGVWNDYDMGRLYRSKDGLNWDSYTYTGFSTDSPLENFMILKNDTMYATSSSSTTSQQGVFRSVDKGHTWTRIVSGLGSTTQVLYDMFLSAEGRLFIGQNFSGIYRSQKVTPQVISFPTATISAVNEIPFNVWQENGNTHVRFTLKESGNVDLEIFDMNGVLKQNYTKGRSFSSGEHELTLSNNELLSGVYVMKIESGGRVSTEKLLLKE